MTEALSPLPKPRARVVLPVGLRLEDGSVVREALVRAITGGDEFWVRMSPDYAESPNELVYKTLLIRRCVLRLGDQEQLDMNTVMGLHVKDSRALEVAIYRLTYGPRAVPPEDPDEPGGVRLAYPLDKVRSEVAFIGYHMHWPLTELLDLPHRERVAWVGEVSRINKRVMEADQ